MKKKLFVILLALLLALFCACSENEPALSSEGSSEEENSAIIEEGTSVKIFTGEDGKFGLAAPNGDILIEAVYDSAEDFGSFFVFGTKISDDMEKVKVFDYSGSQIGFEYNAVEPAPDYEEEFRFFGKIYEGTMLAVEYDENGEPTLAEVPCNRSYLLDEYGTPLVDVPFENYYVETYYNDPNGGYIVGTCAGSRYYFEPQDGEYVLMDKSDPQTTDCECGFTHTSYCFDWYGGYFKHGLNIGEEVFLDPVYSGIYVPFTNGDRVVLYYASYMQGWECGYCKIIDLEKNVLCDDFNVVYYQIYDDGSYIGIGISCGPNAECPVNDEKGFWFIDKDGNILSERFATFGTDENYNNPLPDWSSPDNVATAYLDDGSTVEVRLSDYLCK